MLRPRVRARRRKAAGFFMVLRGAWSTLCIRAPPGDCNRNVPAGFGGQGLRLNSWRRPLACRCAVLPACRPHGSRWRRQARGTAKRQPGRLRYRSCVSPDLAGEARRSAVHFLNRRAHFLCAHPQFPARCLRIFRRQNLTRLAGEAPERAANHGRRRKD